MKKQRTSLYINTATKNNMGYDYGNYRNSKGDGYGNYRNSKGYGYGSYRNNKGDGYGNINGCGNRHENQSDK